MKPTFWTPAEYQANLLKPIGEVTSSMERTGCVVSMETLRGIATEARAHEARIVAELSAWAGREVNWASWQQLGAFLHTAEDGLRMEPSPFWKFGEVDVDAGEIKTDDRALEWLGGHNPEHRDGLNNVRQLRRWQRAANYAEDWLDKAILHGDQTFRLHPSFGLSSDHDTRPGAVTGRFGVKNPPLNQVPKAGTGPMGLLRSAFIAPPGMRLVIVDFSQLEIVILAHLISVLFGDDDNLVRAVRARQDIHGPLARTVFGDLAGDAEVSAAADHDFKEVPKLKALRNLAKAGIYGNNYGKQDFSTTFLPNGEPLGKARGELLSKGLRVKYPGIFKYQDFIRDWITRKGSIMSLFGRLIWLPGAKAGRQGERNRAWRRALNFPMQAGGQEIMAMALLLIHNDALLKELGFCLSLVVHDETVGWAPEGNAERCLARVTELMTTAVELLAPLLAEGHTGATWSEAK